jgi:hypothetical protein
MKMILATLALLLVGAAVVTGAATADPVTRSASSTEAQWTMMRALAHSKDEGYRQHMIAHGFNAASIAPLIAQTTLIEAQLKQDNTAWTKRVCSDRGHYENNVEAFAVELDKQENNRDQRIEKGIKELPAAIGETNAIAFETLATHSNAVTISQPNSEVIREGLMPITEYLDKVCGTEGGAQ